jgi:hypothetical protein
LVEWNFRKAKPGRQLQAEWVKDPEALFPLPSLLTPSPKPRFPFNRAFFEVPRAKPLWISQDLILYELPLEKKTENHPEQSAKHISDSWHDCAGEEGWIKDYSNGKE